MLTVPQDIQTFILSYLSNYDIKNFAKTCSQARKTCLLESLWQKKLSQTLNTQSFLSIYKKFVYIYVAVIEDLTRSETEHEVFLTKDSAIEYLISKIFSEPDCLNGVDPKLDKSKVSLSYQHNVDDLSMSRLTKVNYVDLLEDSHLHPEQMKDFEILKSMFCEYIKDVLRKKKYFNGCDICFSIEKKMLLN